MEWRAEGKHDMKRVLSVLDLVCLGIGMMLGAGVFVTTGFVASTMAGPAVILSYAVAGISALLSSLCYSEFAVRMPLVGGAYTYVNAVFGEYLAWVTVANLILEYILANAAAIRGFAPYFAMLVNQPADKFITPWQGYNLDWWAFGLSLAITILLTLGTKESSRFNIIVTLAHVVLVVFIIIAGLVKSKPSNAQPFFPFEIRGVFNGAALVFFSYIGFDSVACSAEEVRNPKRDLPLGILGALGVVTICYMLMSAVLVMMVPLAALDKGASFAAAFSYVNMDWARYIVALGALMGIITTTLVGMYATSRIVAAVGRQHILPPFLARVHPRWATPYVATISQGIASAVIALFTDFADLAEMVSISTLFAFWMVALALIWHRYCQPGTGAAPPMKHRAMVGAHMGIIVAASLAFTIVYQVHQQAWIGLVVCAAVAIAATISLHLTCKQYNVPTLYGVPLFPYVPALSVAVNAFLLGQLQKPAYERFGIWTGFITLFYIFYSMPATSYREDRSALPGKAVVDSQQQLAEQESVVPPSKRQLTEQDSTQPQALP
uniref:Cationic amino acid transporter C-terminal domain-containing protein n=1 Tax=Tetradesmus obliquus TaxID=3088 RepID=A0A383V9I1_TETOB|eukprot:jgi/Sobl393_1/18210/SZX62228.1